jgi:predicted ribosomally synthesized peptide with SipW-like signal peptide
VYEVKKVLIATLALALVAAFVGIGVYAQFTDVEKSTNNIFTAGTLNLTVDGKEGVNVPVYFNEGNIKPGDSGSAPITLANVGSIDGVASIEGEITTQTPGPDGNNDLAGAIDIVVKYNDVVKYSGKLNALGKTELGFLTSGAEGTVVFEWSLNVNVGNAVQGDSVTFNLVFYLDQAS